MRRQESTPQVGGPRGKASASALASTAARMRAATSVFVHLDPRRPGVRVPAQLAGRARPVLEYGHRMPRPIPGLRLDIEGITATLSFDGRPEATFVPWSAVFAIVPAEGPKKPRVWQEDVPQGVGGSGGEP